MDATYFRKGFGLKAAITPQLTADYASRIVDGLKARDYRLSVGPLTFRLAREFGFCYGVDRAVEYAYETRTKFPDRRLFLVGEIIHNPHVNGRLEELGIRFLRHGADGRFDFREVTPEDAVIIPAFGVTIHDFQRLRALGCVLVDTTCGSVLNVWKRVESYARDGFTAVIHGKHWHEETKATASQVMKYPDGKYLVLLDMEEARPVLDFIRGRGDAESLAGRFAQGCSPGFDFARDLTRIGFANQTTMLAGESLAIAEAFRLAMHERYGAAAESEHVRTFDTICSATQERQDAVLAMLEEPPDLMLVIGGYNSSNTNHLAALCRRHGVRTYHVDDARCIDPEAGTVRHRDPDSGGETLAPAGWLEGVRSIGVTAGASTPNNKIGEAVALVCATAGADLEAVLGDALDP
jgi:4-hydroxy-3-methylbut-2-en-1-yl diphosphate reductase